MQPETRNPQPATRNSNIHWYALYTRPRFEKKVARALEEKGLESFLPVQTVIKQWSDRKKKIEEPLFSCYVFVHVSTRHRVMAVETGGVVRMVSFRGTPASLPDSEIAAIRKVLDHSESFEPVDFLPIGQIVEVVQGPLAGVRGRLMEYRGQKRLVVGVQQIGQAIAVEIHPAHVKPVAGQDSSQSNR